MRLRVLGSLVSVFALVVACGRSSGPDGSNSPDASPILTSSPLGSASANASTEPKQSPPPVPEPPLASDPFGTARSSTKAGCRILAERHVAEKDVRTSFVDGDDLLAIVNRSPTGQLAPDWAPSDLVDLRNGKSLSASECEKFQCLRKDAASALDELMAEM